MCSSSLQKERRISFWPPPSPGTISPKCLCLVFLFSLSINQSIYLSLSLSLFLSLCLSVSLSLFLYLSPSLSLSLYISLSLSPRLWSSAHMMWHDATRRLSTPSSSFSLPKSPSGCGIRSTHHSLFTWPTRRESGGVWNRWRYGIAFLELWVFKRRAWHLVKISLWQFLKLKEGKSAINLSN